MSRVLEIRVSVEPYGERYRATVVGAADAPFTVVRTDEREAVLAAVQQSAHDIADALGVRV